MRHNRYSHHSPSLSSRLGSARDYNGNNLHSGSSSRRDNDSKLIHRTIYNDGAVTSHTPKQTQGRSSRQIRVPATSSARLSSSASRSYRPRSRSRSPVTVRSADDLRNALNGQKMSVPLAHPRDHHSSSEHQPAISDSGCEACGIIGFLTYTQYRQHMDSDCHKANKRRRNGESKSYDNNYEDDSVFRKQPRNSRSRDFLTVDAAGIFQGKQSDNGRLNKRDNSFHKNGGSSSGVVNGRSSVCSEIDSKTTSLKERSQQQEESCRLQEVPEVQDPTVAYGVHCITPIKGLYCRLCKKFFTSEKAALELHAKSASHFVAYKRYVELENLKYQSVVKSSSSPQEDLLVPVKTCCKTDLSDSVSTTKHVKEENLITSAETETCPDIKEESM